jgi:hypothetical protein
VRENPAHGFDKLYPAVRAPSLGKCRCNPLTIRTSWE